MTNILGLYKGEVILVDHNPLWEDEYKKEEQLLKKYLKDYNIKIYHIGSTAIPNIKAKPIIDILISIDKLDIAREFIDIFKEKKEYSFRDDNGIKGEYLIRKGINNFITHYIHIVEKNSDRYKESIYFRDYMIGHPDKVKEYERIKLALASNSEIKREEYTKAKNDFIKEIMIKARQLYE